MMQPMAMLNLCTPVALMSLLKNNFQNLVIFIYFLLKYVCDFIYSLIFISVLAMYQLIFSVKTVFKKTC